MSLSAMKQALDDICGAKLCEINSMSSRAEMIRLMDKAITALRQAIAEAEKQEPVAWREVAGKTTQYYDYNEQGRGEPLYSAPPKREWVGFTHEELAWLNEALNLGGRFAVIEAIEAKLKEKNK
jgi:hypothetical protein